MRTSPRRSPRPHRMGVAPPLWPWRATRSERAAVAVAVVMVVVKRTGRRRRHRRSAAGARARRAGPIHEFACCGHAWRRRPQRRRRPRRRRQKAEAVVTAAVSRHRRSREPDGLATHVHAFQTGDDRHPRGSGRVADGHRRAALRNGGAAVAGGRVGRGGRGVIGRSCAVVCAA